MKKIKYSRKDMVKREVRDIEESDLSPFVGLIDGFWLY